MAEPATRRTGVLAGLVTGLAGVAVAHALTTVMGLRATPVVAVAEVVVEITPGGLAEALIQLVGQWDKPLLIVGVTLALLALSAWAGALAGRRVALGHALFGAMGAAALAATVTRPEALAYDVLPVVGGTVTWFVVLGLLINRAPAAEPGSAEPERRRFLMTSAGVAVGALVVAAGAEFLGRARRGVETARRLLRLPVTHGVVPSGVTVPVEGVEPWRTPNATFYRIDTALVVPAVDPTEWRLRIHGMVETEIELSYADLLERELSEEWVTICCVSNEVGGDLIGNAWWSGVRIADILAEAGTSPDADAVLQTSQDDWTCGTPLAALTDDRNAILAIAMNGEPLPVEHGFPVRMVVPALYGYVSATKWLVDLEVTRFDRISAYWTERGWAELGPIKTQSRIDVPRSGDSVETGPVPVGGVAWAQGLGIERVEYRLDGGPWVEAELGRVVGLDTWVQWAGRVEAGPGEHALTVRATDRSGYTQTPVRRDVVPDGATGWHRVLFTAE